MLTCIANLTSLSYSQLEIKYTRTLSLPPSLSLPPICASWCFALVLTNVVTGTFDVTPSRLIITVATSLIRSLAPFANATFSSALTIAVVGPFDVALPRLPTIAATIASLIQFLASLTNKVPGPVLR
ncbi:hypothetical protein NL676_017291 [Syzygium grande]|nr:hypothetical protein NL676_017291 [Syzygium grande]